MEIDKNKIDKVILAPLEQCFLIMVANRVVLEANFQQLLIFLIFLLIWHFHFNYVRLSKFEK